jgi:hypothetical protein
LMPPAGPIGPFIPIEGPDGPCRRESSGDAGCVGLCQGGMLDGIEFPINPPGGPIGCCICDVSYAPVARCPVIRDCASARMACFGRTRPIRIDDNCRMHKCLRVQLECLASAQGTGACRDAIDREIKRWRDIQNIFPPCKASD